MASKTKKINAEDIKDIQGFIQSLNAKYSDTPFMLLSNHTQSDVKTISTGSFILDSIIGGGLAEGRIIEIYGSESSGKTSIALTAIANVQKDGGYAAFIDVEQALDKKYARKLGVDMNKMLITQPMIAEDVMRMVIDLCNSGQIKIIVVDSVASLVTRAELEDESFDKQQVATTARLLSKALKQVAKVASDNKVTVIFLNQTRDKVGVMYGPTTTTTGGKALRFYSSQRIEVKRKEQILDGNEVVGARVELKCVKSKICPPFGTGLTVLTYNKGINQVAEIVELGEELGIVEKVGRTYYCKNTKGLKPSKDIVIADDKRIKIAVDLKNVLKALKDNKALLEMIRDDVLFELNKKNELVEIDGEETEESLEEDIENEEE